MKRDLELVRTILLKIEESDNFCAGYAFKVEGYAKEIVLHHCYLMHNAGLIVGDRIGCPDPFNIPQQATPVCIDWKGYEFLDACREPQAWEKAKGTLADAGRDLGNVTLGVLQGLLTRILANDIGL